MRKVEALFMTYILDIVTTVNFVARAVAMDFKIFPKSLDVVLKLILVKK
jgi:hypothetical protein